MIEVSLYLGIEEIVLLGDYCDFYAVSRYPKDPRVGVLLSEEIDSVRAGLDQLDSLFPEAKKVYLEGNHEARLESYLINQAPALFGVTECRELFGLSQRPKWTYIPFDRHQQYSVLGTPLLAFHRPKASSPKLHIARTLVSSVYGDIHKIEEARAKGLDGADYVAFCPGWLGDVRSRVFDYMASTPQWQTGFAIVSVEPNSNSFHHEIINIKDNYTAITHGKVFKG